MDIEVLKSKVHRVVITEANLNYIGSLTLDEDLMDAANLIPNEKVQVVNVNNGARIETYIITGKRRFGYLLPERTRCPQWSCGRYCDCNFLCTDGFRRSQKIQTLGCFSKRRK